MNSVNAVLLGLLSLAGAACSDTDGTTNGASGGANGAGMSNAGAGNTAGLGNTAGASNTAGAGNGQNAGGASGGATNGSVFDTNADKSGQVIVYAFAFGVSRTLSAEFRLTQKTTCEWTRYGDCQVSSACAADSTQTTWASAGTISLTSASPQVDVSIDPDGSNVYPRAVFGASLTGGEMLRVAATGGTVPAFSADLNVPKLLVIDQPAPDATGRIKAPATADLVISFSRGVEDVSLQLLGSNQGHTLSCRAPFPSSTLTVQAAALAALGAGAEVSAYTLGVKDAPITGWNVLLGTLTEAMTPDHKAAVSIQVE